MSEHKRELLTEKLSNLDKAILSYLHKRYLFVPYVPMVKLNHWNDKIIYQNNNEY